MAEDEQDDEASAPQEPASQPAAEPGAPAAPVAPPTPAAPPNKLHEWGAALGIMMFLALVLYVFLNFLRSSSL